jgi:hypothetical protein
LEEIVDGPRPLRGAPGEGRTLAGLALQAGEVLLPRGVVSQKEPGGLREGALEVRMADCLARGAGALAGGVLGTLDEPAVGDEVLPPGQALEVVHLREQDEGQARADAGHRA